MGIEKFQSSFIVIYGLLQINIEEQKDQLTQKNIFFDFNSTLHQSIIDLHKLLDDYSQQIQQLRTDLNVCISINNNAKQIAMKFIDQIDQLMQGQSQENIQKNIDQIMVLLGLVNFIRHLHNICDPVDKNIFVCIDGCVSINKINEQKQRKLYSNLLHMNGYTSDKVGFNRSKISPQTKFMQQFEKQLSTMMQNLKINNYIYTSTNFDEAEFKISRLIRKHNFTDFAIVSPDSDFIIISMILAYQLNITQGMYLVQIQTSEESYTYVKKDITKLGQILQQNIKIYNEQPDLQVDQESIKLIEMKKNRQLIDSLMSQSEGQNKISTKEIYRDILMVLEFFGNDFIPAMKSIQLDEYNLDILLVSYVEIINKYGYTLFSLVENNRNPCEIIVDLLYKFDENYQKHNRSLKEIQRQMREQQQGQPRKEFKEDPLQIRMINPYKVQVIRKYQNFLYQWMYEYQLDRFNNIQESQNGHKQHSYMDLCKKYMESFLWIKNLYFDNKYNDWVYDSHYAPPISHLREYKNSLTNNIQVNPNPYKKVQAKQKFDLDLEFVMRQDQFKFYHDNITPELQFMLANNLDLDSKLLLDQIETFLSSKDKSSVNKIKSKIQKIEKNIKYYFKFTDLIMNVKQIKDFNLKAMDHKTQIINIFKEQASDGYKYQQVSKVLQEQIKELNKISTIVFPFMKYSNKYVYFSQTDLNYELFEQIVKSLEM